ncbi:hypothetical protein [Flagellimonas pacifica]|uniref:Uncharacterized protein n=1 Tax=Flagellimonas pacifica TaxID=1247520 RepID=A0A285MHK3_9FLAO|nr:hypothetical protein [Allomuricauda parva]SNY94971.1 hypothetical protein SAMN06265377_0634 [Allomuricauda parva]
MIKASYILLFVILLGVLLWTLNNAMKKIGVAPSKRNSALAITIIGTLSWLTLQFFVWNTGFYYDLSLPPRIPLFMVFPVFLFIALLLFRNRNRNIIVAIPIALPIAVQSFRAVIEVLFYFTFSSGVLPIQVTFEGANYDVLIGLSAIVIAIYANRPNASAKVLVVWNIIGILVVLFAAFIFITSFYFPAIWGNTGIPIAFNQFPYLLLPTFLMPFAVFLHVLSIIQLTRKN